MDNGKTFDNLGIKTHLEAAEKLLKYHQQLLCCKNSVYTFDKDMGMWSSENILNTSIISSYDYQLCVITYNKKSRMENKFKVLLIMIQTRCVDNNLIFNKSQSSLGKL